MTISQQLDRHRILPIDRAPEEAEHPALSPGSGVYFLFGVIIRASCHAMKRKRHCSVYRCEEPPYLGGLCQAHAEEARVKAQRRDDALEVLHYGVIDGALPSDIEIREELVRLGRWWRAACDSLNYRIPYAILKGEAEPATSWCIALAQELIDAERAICAGKSFDKTMLNGTRQWVWERFGNLERRLMSNGVARPERKP